LNLSLAMENGQKYRMQRSTRSSGDSDQAAAAGKYRAGRGDDGDNIETQVADEIVEQALDAVVLLARDPRYAELVRRRPEGLK
jgi:hypothetical protein